MGDSHVGLQARLMSQAMRKLTGAIAKSNCCVIFINQIREKIGVMFGSPETTPGGRALKFYSSVRIDIRRIGRSRTAIRTSATASARRWSRTRSLRPSAPPSSTSCSTRDAGSLPLVEIRVAQASSVCYARTLLFHSWEITPT
jgi:hypothetical protein